MIKVLIFIALVFALGFGFAWLADMPGDVAVTVGDQLIHVSLMVAAVAIVAIVASIMLTWWLVRVIWTSPQRANRFFRARKRDRGYQSLSTGIIAAGAGDTMAARRMLKQAGGLLNETTEPLIQLLDAQTTLLEGKHGDARQKFEAMLEDPELRMLGMRGLYMEAQRLGDREAQRHYAEKAAELAPQLIWAGKAAIDLKTASGDWDGAIKLLEKQKTAKQITKEDANRKRAVLLTALALDLAESEPAKAKQAALEAHRLAPDFAPAAVIAAETAFRLNEMRRGVKVLETTWRKAPHPDVALAYVNARPGDSALDRLKRARRLEAIKPNNTDSSLIIAQMALEAGEFEAARKSVAAVLRNEPRESAYMLMADIEDAETGDQGKVREWLSRAVRAARDPAWTADGVVSETWAPFSPVTGRIDAFEWKVPVERAGTLLENDLDPMQPGTPAGRIIDATDDAPVVPPPAVQEAEVTAAAPETIEEVPSPAEPVKTPEAAEAEQPAPEAVEAAAPAEEAETVVEAPAEEPEEAPKAEAPEAAAEAPPETSDLSEEPAKAGPSPPTVANGETDADGLATEPETADGPVPAEEGSRPVYSPEEPDEAVAKPPIPDDPGVDPDVEPDKPRRFRLF